MLQSNSKTFRIYRKLNNYMVTSGHTPKKHPHNVVCITLHQYLNRESEGVLCVDRLGAIKLVPVISN